MAENISIDLDEITTKMNALKDLQAQQKFDLKNTEDEIKRLELVLQAVLDSEGSESKSYNGYWFGWETKTQNRFDQTLFSEENPELYAKYKKDKEYRNFKFKVGM